MPGVFSVHIVREAQKLTHRALDVHHEIVRRCPDAYQAARSCCGCSNSNPSIWSTMVNLPSALSSRAYLIAASRVLKRPALRPVVSRMTQ